MRAVRPDKLQLAALEATLHHYLVPGEAVCRVPTLAMVATNPDSLRQRCEGLARRLADLIPCSWIVGVEKTCSRVGGGALPGRDLEGHAVVIDSRGQEAALAAALRTGTPPVVARVHGGRLILDPRTLLPGQEELVIQAFRDLTLA